MSIHALPDFGGAAETNETLNVNAANTATQLTPLRRTLDTISEQFTIVLFPVFESFASPAR